MIPKMQMNANSVPQEGFLLREVLRALFAPMDKRLIYILQSVKCVL